MTIAAVEAVPLSLPTSVDPAYFSDFGREIKGLDVAQLTAEQFKTVENLLYKHGVLLFRNTTITPEQQYSITKSFDPSAAEFGHGHKIGTTPKSMLHAVLKTIPSVPQVHLIGNGIVYNHNGLSEAKMYHPHHRNFHKTHVPDEDNLKFTRFYRWHMDAALYDLSPSKVSSLYGINVPSGEPQICRYDDGTGDELEVPLGSTSFVSGKTIFDILPAPLKSLAVRTRVKYAPHPFIWMSTAHAMSTGLGLETEGLEVPLDELPEWSKDKIQILPMTWKNPVTGDLHHEVAGCGIMALLVSPLPEGVARTAQTLYPDGAEITDLKTVRELVYKMQRPGIAPKLVYPHSWAEKDLVLFHNRGVLHSASGAFKPTEIRALHQCILAGSDDPAGPTEEDLRRYA